MSNLAFREITNHSPPKGSSHGMPPCFPLRIVATMIRGGAWRDDSTGPMVAVSGPVGKERVHFHAPPAPQLDEEMRVFGAVRATRSPASRQTGMYRRTDLSARRYRGENFTTIFFTASASA